MSLRTIAFTITICLASLGGFAQQPGLSAGTYANLMAPAEKPQFNFAKSGNTNEVRLLFSSLFLFYKSVISSQDASRCSFSPSCSVYGYHAVRKKGVFIGILSTFDRLLRCNGLSPEMYELDPKTGLLIDHP